jgi:hypothetical protein
MKNVLVTILISVFVGGISVAVSAQESRISPEKKELIAEVITITKADKLTSDVARAVANNYNEGYPALIRSIVKARTDLTATQKATVVNYLLKRENAAEQYRQRVLDSIDFREFVKQIYYPLYDKYFTADEIRDLIQFYRSSTGQKVLTVTPEMSAESVAITQKLLLPKIVNVSDQVIGNDIAAAKKTLFSKPVQN